MRPLVESEMMTNPLAFTATPTGLLKRAAVPAPSRYPLQQKLQEPWPPSLTTHGALRAHGVSGSSFPPPASETVVPSMPTARMRLFPLSATIRKPEAVTASPFGPLKCAFEPTPSTAIAALSTLFVTPYSPAKRLTRPLGEIARMR